MGRNWVGGDIASLHTVADELNPCEGKVKTTVDDIDGKIGAISGAAGWSGDAAKAFEGHWEVSSAAAGAIGSYCSAAGKVIGDLAGLLDRLEKDLESLAGEARGKGVPIGDDGRPPTAPLTEPALSAAKDYAAQWQEIQQTAQGFRVEADNALLELARDLVKVIDNAAGDGLSNADKVALGDYARGFGAIPAAVRAHLHDLLDKAQDKYDAAKSAWQAARDATPPGQRMPTDVKAARSDALRDLNALKSDLGVMEHEAHPLARFLDLRVGDGLDALPRVGSAWASAADGSRVLRFLGDVPVIDVAAVAGGTYLQATDDIQKGENPVRAWGEDLASNAGGVAAGVAVGAAVAGGLAAAGAAPLVAVGGAALVGGAVAVGVGDLVYEGFHEHWDEDIQQHGVVVGIADGVGHTFANTGKDIGHMASSVWHGIFG